jgi:hypothetical protein
VTEEKKKIDRTAFWSRTVAGVIALIAGAASFEHIASVAIASGERMWVAYAIPIAIDGLIVVGVLGMLEDKRTGRRRWSARAAVLLGVAGTLAANVASAEPDWTARLIAIAAPVCFLVSIEVLTSKGRLRKQSKRELEAEARETALKVEDAEPATEGIVAEAEQILADASTAKEAKPARSRRRRSTRPGDAKRRVEEVLKENPEAAKNVAELARAAGTSWGTANKVVLGES